mmetsp:Transcript_16679/g.34178  ORF Transcript_16679/g.34178 Transcript_16679/m.34178 type:complete len:87 (-) Transcript_16679:54-314(-)
MRTLSRQPNKHQLIMPSWGSRNKADIHSDSLGWFEPSHKMTDKPPTITPCFSCFHLIFIFIQIAFVKLKPQLTTVLPQTVSLPLTQ